MNLLAPRRYALSRALAQLRAHPLGFICALLATVATLIAPVLCALLLAQAWPWPITLSAEINLFLAPQTSANDRDQLKTKLQALPLAHSVSLIDKDAALRALLHGPGSSPRQTQDTAPTDNPLPDVLILKLRPGASAAQIESLSQQLQSWPPIELVQTDTAWLGAWQHAGRLARVAAVLIGVLASLILIWVIATAIVLQSRIDRDEAKLLIWAGATGRFIRRPYVYLGALTLSLAMALAITLAHGILTIISPSIAALTAPYGIDLHWAAPSWQLSLALIAGAGLLGGSIASISVQSNT
ncbi:MAG TPA: permease-like cell division protein FtsX [Burkholderiaceae bacterium]|nr:permease-like cell division protein FtsX [Burkholderiaceae bacterium]